MTVAVSTSLCRPVASGMAIWRVATSMASLARPIMVTKFVNPLVDSMLGPARVILAVDASRAHLVEHSLAVWAKRPREMFETL